MIRTIQSLVLISGVLLSLVACSSGPPPKLYLLSNQLADNTTVASDKFLSIGALGISEIELPSYASDPKIASLLPDGTVQLDDKHRWAEEPVDAITQWLAYRLSQHTQDAVLVEPWPREFEPIARIEVSFNQLLREPNGGARMMGQVNLLSSDGRRLIGVEPFAIRQVARSVNPRAYFAAIRQGIDEVVLLALETLLSRGTSS